MRRYLIIFIFIISLLGLAFYLFSFYMMEPSVIDERENKPFQADDEDLSISNSQTEGDLKAVWLKIENNRKLFLENNLEDKFSSSRAMTNNQCSSLVSAYFYDNDMNPLGLVIIGGNIVSQAKRSSLLNGYFFVTDEDNAQISTNPPINARIAVQTGPMLMFNSETRNISSSSDEEARRVVVATDDQDSVFFISVFDTRNPVRGPNLEQLPELIFKISEENNLNLSDALNLDGGSHSAFVTEFVSLREISTIGGYFCVKP